MILAVVAAVISRYWGSVHPAGVWVFVLMTHGMLVYFFGEGLQQLAMIVGLVVAPIMVLGGGGFRSDVAVVSAMAMFLLAVLLSFLTSGGGYESFYKLITYIKPLAVCFLVSGVVRYKAQLAILSRYLILAAVIGSIFNIYQQITGTQLNYNVWDKSLSRAASLAGDPNDTALLMLGTIPLVYFNIIQAKRLPERVLYLSTAALIAIGIVLTGSRAGFLVLVLLMLGLMLHRPGAPRYNLMNVPSIRNVALVTVFGIACLVAAPGYYWSRMETLVSGKEVGQSESLYDREFLLKRGFEIWCEHPVLGVGPGQFHFAVYGENPLARKGHEKKVVAHNMYIEFMVEFGLLGFTSFMAIVAIAFSRLRKLDVTTFASGEFRYIGYAYGAALAGMLVMGATLSQGYNPVLWFFLGCGLSAGFMLHKESGTVQQHSHFNFA